MWREKGTNASVQGLYSDREPISQSFLSKMLHNCNEIGSGENKSRTWRPKSATSDETSLNFALSVEENPNVFSSESL